MERAAFYVASSLSDARSNRSYGVNRGMVPQFYQEIGIRDQKLFRRFE